MNFNCTRFAEFQDKNLESRFFSENTKNSLKCLRYVFLISCSIFLLLFFFDYFFLDAGGFHNIILYSLIPRLLIFALSLTIFAYSKKSTNFKMILDLMSYFVVFIFLTHLFMVSHFINVNLVFEVLDVVLVMLGLFFIPNRWLINLICSALTCVIFLIYGPHFLSGLTMDIIVELIIYFSWFIMIISMLLLRTNRYKRSQFSKGLELERLTLTDPLTKAFNRKACDNMINKMCEEKAGFSIILFDIDDFKKINDTYGHMIGDEVLVSIADTVRRNIRDGDTLARWGGEEFIILLANTSLESSVEIAEKLRNMIYASVFEGFHYEVTASFGVTECLPDDSLSSLMRRVDQFLYSAKRAGKNNVCFSMQ